METRSRRKDEDNWASVTGPSGPSKTYSLSTLTMGSLRRSALSASWERVNSFSRASRRRRASSHCSRETTSGRLIAKPPVSERVRVSDSRHRHDEPVRRGWTGGGRRSGKFHDGLLLRQVATEQLPLYSNHSVASMARGRTEDARRACARRACRRAGGAGGAGGAGDGRDEAFPRRRCNAPGLRLARVRRVGLGGSPRSAGSLVGDGAPLSQPRRCNIMAVITATMLHRCGSF